MIFLKNEASGLNDYENVVSYISQNAPVPYDPTAFVWGEEIILEKVFTAILASNASNASAIIDQILLSFTKENKN